MLFILIAVLRQKQAILCQTETTGSSPEMLERHRKDASYVVDRGSFRYIEMVGATVTSRVISEIEKNLPIIRHI